MRRGTHALGTALAAVVFASGLRLKPRRIRFARSQPTVTAVRSAIVRPNALAHVDSKIHVCDLYVFMIRSAMSHVACCITSGT